MMATAASSTNPLARKIKHAAARLRAAVPDSEYQATISATKRLCADNCDAHLFELRLALAKYLATIGRIHPLWPNSKKPILCGWPKLATQDMAVIREWVRRHPECNWGITANVVDVDTKERIDDFGGVQCGRATFDLLAVQNGEPETLTVTTPTGGTHLYVTDELPNGTDTLGIGIDTRAEGRGYVVAAGSYVVANDEDVRVTGFYKTTRHAPVTSVPWLAALQGERPSHQERGETIADPEPLISPALLAECLGGLDPDDFPTNAEWEPLAMSCHSATAGQGFPEFYEWCHSKGYGGKDDIETRWNSFHVHSAGDRTIDGAGGLVESLRKAGRDDLVARIVAAEFAADPAEPLTAEQSAHDAAAKASKDAARDAADAVRSRPSEQREKRYSFAEICEQWVWIVPLKRYIRRERTKTGEYLSLDKETFNDRFRYLRGDHSNLTNRLNSNTEHTIRKLDGIVFRPGDENEFTVDGYWNNWRPSPIIPKQGDTSLFDAHIAYLFPDKRDQDLLLNWMAGVLQHPETKPRHQLFIQGRVQGTGKTLFPRLLRELLGHGVCQALTQDIIENGFTGWAIGTKFAWIEEVRNLSNKQTTNKLHTWASESTITINQKNLPTFVMDQAIAFMLMSNKDDALALDLTDRRYLVLNTEARVHPQGSAYYDRLYGVHGVGGILHAPNSLAAIYWKLLHRPIDGYSVEQPAPNTSAKRAMIDAAAPDAVRWMLNNADIAPLRYRVVTLEEIIDAMPRRLQNKAGVDNDVRAALRDRFNAKPWPEQIRPDGRRGDKVRVWVLHGLANGKISSKDVLHLYREDRETAHLGDQSEAQDFTE
jgi:hypothetical protein